MWVLYFLAEGNIKTTFTLLVVLLLLAISSFVYRCFCGALCACACNFGLEMEKKDEKVSVWEIIVFFFIYIGYYIYTDVYWQGWKEINKEKRKKDLR